MIPTVKSAGEPATTEARRLRFHNLYILTLVINRNSVPIRRVHFKTVRDLVYKGRIMLAIDRYKNGQVSLGKAAELAGLSVGDMMTTLEEYGVKSNLEVEDYLEGLEKLRKIW